jgi:hypothetical protein
VIAHGFAGGIDGELLRESFRVRQAL